jgi:hypothetical protein
MITDHVAQVTRFEGLVTPRPERSFLERRYEPSSPTVSVLAATLALAIEASGPCHFYGMRALCWSGIRRRMVERAGQMALRTGA